MQTFLFNPWNDLALAANDPHYTPPASARQMAQDLSDLPLLWMPHDRRRVSVWGWSPLLISQLRDMGIDESLLPTVEQMDAYRAASSRQTAVNLLERLRHKWPEPFDKWLLVGTSSWCTTEEEVAAAVTAYGGFAMLKAPWSSSGRGVKKLSTVNCQLSTWIHRTIVRQGSVEVEPLYNKVVDFAVEYWSEEGHVRDEGLSLFTTTAGGVYSGNLVASEEEKLRRLSAHISPALLAETRNRLVDLLNEAFHTGLLPAWYTGPLGIDMMICRTPLPNGGGDGGEALHPFVELNLRMTMGWVALQLSKKLPPHETRLFRIVQEGGRYHYELNDTSE